MKQKVSIRRRDGIKQRYTVGKTPKPIAPKKIPQKKGTDKITNFGGILRWSGPIRPSQEYEGHMGAGGRAGVKKELKKKGYSLKNETYDVWDPDSLEPVAYLKTYGKKNKHKENFGANPWDHYQNVSTEEKMEQLAHREAKKLHTRMLKTKTITEDERDFLEAEEYKIPKNVKVIEGDNDYQYEKANDEMERGIAQSETTYGDED